MPRRPSRWTIAPLYLAAGLAVSYVVIMHMIPAMSAVIETPGRPNPQPASSGLAGHLSKLAREHHSGFVTALVIVGLVGFLLPLMLRPARYVVWLLVVLVLAADVLLAAGGYWHMLQAALKEASH